MEIVKAAKKRGLFYLALLSLAVMFLAMCYIASCTAYAFELDPNMVYSIQDQEIVGYTQSEITLANGTVIPINPSTIGKYLSQIKTIPRITKSAILYTSTTNYALKLNSSGNYSAWDRGNATRIQQGDCVQLGDTVDISGDGWYTGYLAYYGIGYDGYGNSYNNTITAILPIKSQNLSAFYIDPEYFHQYPGWWYIYYPYYQISDEGTTTFTNHGNDRIFYVGDVCKKPNATIAQEEVKNLTALYKMRAENLSMLSPKTVPGADYIVSRNETTNLPAPNDSRVWIFGRTVGKYDAPVIGNTTAITAQEGANWESGSYNFIFISKDPSGFYDQTYDTVEKTIDSPLRSISSKYVGDSQPRLVEGILKNLINVSPMKTYNQYSISLQDPEIDVMKLDQWQGADNITLITIAGYTNANPGDLITIEMDKGKIGDRREIAAHTWTAHAWGNMSEYRYWNTSFLFNVQNEFPGQHSFTISDNAGATVNAPFYVYREPARHYIPENYLQYVNNSPFIQPEIVKVPYPVVQTVTVEVPVPPSQESVNEGMRYAVESLAIKIIEGIVGIIMAFFVGRFIYRSWRRRKWHQQ